MRNNQPVTGVNRPVPDGTTLVSRTDAKGRIVSANDAFVAISGFGSGFGGSGFGGSGLGCGFGGSGFGGGMARVGAGAATRSTCIAAGGLLCQRRPNTRNAIKPR